MLIKVLKTIAVNNSFNVREVASKSFMWLLNAQVTLPVIVGKIKGLKIPALAISSHTTRNMAKAGTFKFLGFNGALFAD